MHYLLPVVFSFHHKFPCLFSLLRYLLLDFFIPSEIFLIFILMRYQYCIILPFLCCFFLISSCTMNLYLWNSIFFCKKCMSSLHHFDVFWRMYFFSYISLVNFFRCISAWNNGQSSVTVRHDFMCDWQDSFSARHNGRQVFKF